jgi:hypothetical protein
LLFKDVWLEGGAVKNLDWFASTVFTDIDGALERARSRLSALRAEPVKHARHSLKVLIQFLMLELESTTRQKLIGRLNHARLIRNISVLIETPQPQAIEWAIDSLISGGHLREHEGHLLLG